MYKYKSSISADAADATPHEFEFVRQNNLLKIIMWSRS